MVRSVLVTKSLTKSSELSMTSSTVLLWSFVCVCVCVCVCACVCVCVRVLLFLTYDNDPDIILPPSPVLGG